VITADDLPDELGGKATTTASLEAWTRKLGSWAEQELGRAGEPLLKTALPEVERVLITAALKQARGHRQEAARLLGWGRNTLTRKMRNLQLG
jgi:two-component system nitrogen regulation response regulator GlnG